MDRKTTETKWSRVLVVDYFIKIFGQLLSIRRRHRRRQSRICGIRVVCGALLALAGGVLFLNDTKIRTIIFPSAGLTYNGQEAAVDTNSIKNSFKNLSHLAVKEVVYDCEDLGKGCSSSNLLILQTSDGQGWYARMLDATQAVQLAYAQKWGFSYFRWDGVAKGHQAWHATFNRIFLLHELYLLREQYEYHWVLFMDPGMSLRGARAHTRIHTHLTFSNRRNIRGPKAQR